MSELGLVAAAISSIINCPVKTYDEYLAEGLDALPNQILDLGVVHKYSFVRQGDDKLVQKPLFRQGDEIDEIVERIVRRRSRQVGEKDEKVAHRRSFNEKVVHRRSFVRQDDGKVQVNPNSNILPPHPIQIFVKTS